MLAQQRHAAILRAARRNGAVLVADLTAMLGVSEMTVRRDLQKMEIDGVITRVHGGAILENEDNSPGIREPDFTEKTLLARAAKSAIAARAAMLVEPGTVVGVSAGTTAWTFATHLAEVTPLTVVTNSVTASERIAGLGTAAGQTVILTGGIRTPSAGLVGPIAEQAIRSLNIDQLFIGCYGMDPAAGLTSPSFAEAETNKALVSRARQVVVLADATKWRTLGLASWAELGQIDILITDDSVPDDGCAVLAGAVGELILAHPET